MSGEPNIAEASYKANLTGADTSRTLGDRAADIINVFDFGAQGIGASHDDYPHIQAAFDAAFGPANNPHGLANAKLNKSVFFPNGDFYCASGSPTLTRVVGGHIFGTGPNSTTISGTGASGRAALRTNGASGLLVEGLSFNSNGADAFGVDLDWDGTSGGNGLNGNTFRDCSMGNNAGIALLIANSGNDGARNLFEQVACMGSVAGAKIVGASAFNNTFNGGGNGFGDIGYWCYGGSMTIIQPSLAANFYDVQVDSGHPVVIIGGRTESGGHLKVNDGIVTLRGMCFSGLVSAVGSISGTTYTGDPVLPGGFLIASGVAPGTRVMSRDLGGGTYTVSPSQDVSSRTMTVGMEVANIQGGLVSLDGVVADEGMITGISGTTLYLRANSFARSDLLDWFDGTTIQS